MQAEIISIGSELTSGARLDTNSQWLSCQLGEIGIPVRFHSTMADDRAAMLEVFQTAVRRSDIVLVTGGLGPTLDDLTRELLAEVVNQPLQLHQPSLDFIKDMFARRGRTMPERNSIQAMFPAGSEPIANPIGTAPGIWLEIAREGREPCRMASMPGVPSEMKKMYLDQVRPRLPDDARVMRSACVNTFGMGESAVEEMLGDLTARDRNPEVGITASGAVITLRISAYGATVSECDTLVDQTRETICRTLGDIVFGFDDDTLETVVTRLLIDSGLTLSLIDGGTKGQLSRYLALAPRAAECGVIGLVGDAPAIPKPTDSDAHSEGDVGIDGHISREAAEHAAAACRAHFGTDFALAVTPMSQPQADGDVVRAWIALAGPNGSVEVNEHLVLSDVAIAHPRAARTALNMLRLKLQHSGDTARHKS